MDKILIFGASSTLAQEVARALQETGQCEVRLVGHKSVAPNHYSLSFPCIGFCDITDWNSVKHIFQSCADSGFIPNVVINCVGVSGQCPFPEMSFNEWRRVVSVNIDGAFNICQNAVTFMRNLSDVSSIILIGSAYGIRYVPCLVHYCTSKAAIAALVKSLSVEIAQFGMTINSVAPAMFQSEMTRPFYNNENYISQLKKHYPAEKLIELEAVVNAVVFLVQNRSLSITGTEMVVDGGFLNMVEGGIK